MSLSPLRGQLPYAYDEKMWDLSVKSDVPNEVACKDDGQANPVFQPEEILEPPKPVLEEKQLLAKILKEEMVTNAPQDQRDLLSRVSIEELIAIHSCYHHPLMGQIVDDVWLGRWESLIELAKQKSDLPIYTILKAAFCQGKLGNKEPSHEGIDNLVSAYIFLGPAMAGQSYRIYHFDEVVLQPEIWGDISKRWDVNDVPERQRYFILVEAEAYLPEVRGLMKALHDERLKNNVAGGICFHSDKGWALGAAGLIRSDRLLKGLTPLYGRRLRSPKRRFDHLLKRQVDIALLEPSDVKPKLIHGVSQQGNLSLSHDGFHAAHVAKATTDKLEYPALLSLGQKIYGVLGRMPAYSKNIQTQASDKTYYSLLTSTADRELPTLEDWVRFFIYETAIAIQDGEVFWKKIPEDTIKSTIRMIYNRQRHLYRELNNAVAPPLFPKFVPLLNQHLSSLKVVF